MGDGTGQNIRFGGNAPRIRLRGQTADKTKKHNVMISWKELHESPEGTFLRQIDYSSIMT